MYTICWTETNTEGISVDKWERCESRRELASLLIRRNLSDSEDVLIFGPEAEESLLTCEDIFASI